MSFLKRPIPVLVSVGVVFVSLACSIGSFIPQLGGNPTATPETVGETKPAATMVATSSAAKPTRSVLKATPTLEDLQPVETTVPELADIQAGLDQLDSYQMDFVMMLEGKDPLGKDAEQSLKLFQEIIRSQNNMHLKIEGTGVSTSQASGAIETFQIGNTGYLLMVPENQTTPTCLSYSSDTPMVDMGDMLSPEDMLGEVQEHTLIARGVMVNGVMTDHYKINKGGLGIGTVTSESAEAWLAQDGNYLVRYAGQAEGEFELTAVKITGTITWSYDLTKINRLLEIALAQECLDAGGAILDLPIPANATDQGSFSGIITFSSPDSPKEVADFYRGELPLNGWTIDNDTAMEALVMMQIKKDKRIYQIMITPGDGDNDSSVMITKKQE